MRLTRVIRRCIAAVIVICFGLQSSGFAQVLAPGAPAFAAVRSVPCLRYVSVNKANPFNYFNFLMEPGTVGSDTRALDKESRTLVNYFLTALTVSNSDLWVNLQPGQDDRIISETLAATELGRVLLEQDLLLKRDTAKALHPGNPAGRVFWEALYTAIGEKEARTAKLDIANRVWIVPDEAVLYETADGAFIVKATLKVLSENEYLKRSPRNERQALIDALFKEYIIPEVTRDINAAPRYAPLRQAFMSLILAEWYKRKHGGGTSAYALSIGKGYLKGLESSVPWSRQEIWKRYSESYHSGEYTIEDVVFGVRRLFVSGGISFAFDATPITMEVTAGVPGAVGGEQATAASPLTITTEPPAERLDKLVGVFLSTDPTTGDGLGASTGVTAVQSAQSSSPAADISREVARDVRGADAAPKSQNTASSPVSFTSWRQRLMAYAMAGLLSFGFLTSQYLSTEGRLANLETQTSALSVPSDAEVTAAIQDLQNPDIPAQTREKKEWELANAIRRGNAAAAQWGKEKVEQGDTRDYNEAILGAFFMRARTDRTAETFLNNYVSRAINQPGYRQDYIMGEVYSAIARGAALFEPLSRNNFGLLRTYFDHNARQIADAGYAELLQPGISPDKTQTALRLLLSNDLRSESATEAIIHLPNYHKSMLDLAVWALFEEAISGRVPGFDQAFFVRQADYLLVASGFIGSHKGIADETMSAGLMQLKWKAFGDFVGTEGHELGHRLAAFNLPSNSLAQKHIQEFVGDVAQNYILSLLAGEETSAKLYNDFLLADGTWTAAPPADQLLTLIENTAVQQGQHMGARVFLKWLTREAREREHPLAWRILLQASLRTISSYDKSSVNKITFRDFITDVLERYVETVVPQPVSNTERLPGNEIREFLEALDKARVENKPLEPGSEYVPESGRRPAESPSSSPAETRGSPTRDALVAALEKEGYPRALASPALTDAKKEAADDVVFVNVYTPADEILQLGEGKKRLHLRGILLGVSAFVQKLMSKMGQYAPTDDFFAEEIEHNLQMSRFQSEFTNANADRVFGIEILSDRPLINLTLTATHEDMHRVLINSMRYLYIDGDLDNNAIHESLAYILARNVASRINDERRLDIDVNILPPTILPSEARKAEALIDPASKEAHDAGSVQIAFFLDALEQQGIEATSDTWMALVEEGLGVIYRTGRDGTVLTFNGFWNELIGRYAARVGRSAGDKQPESAKLPDAALPAGSVRLLTPAKITAMLQQGSDSAGPSAASPVVADKSFEDKAGGIDFTQIELTLANEEELAGMNAADCKILRAAKALKDGWTSLAALYCYEASQLVRDKIVKEIGNANILRSVVAGLGTSFYPELESLITLNNVRPR